MTGCESTSSAFPSETIQRLFEAIEVDDVVDAQVELPEPIVLTCPDKTMQQCYALCLQFWKEGFTRIDLWRLVRKLLHGHRWTIDEQRAFKHIRARYKHLRFAQQLYGKRHRRNRWLGRTTVNMGHLQDAFRADDRLGIAKHGGRLRFLLSPPVWASLRYAATHSRLDNPAGFIAYRQRKMRCLKSMLLQTVFTGDEFHDMRKIVSEQVSFYDTLRSIYPEESSYYSMSRFLAAINGLMGAQHDDMVAGAKSGWSDYGTPMPLDEGLRARLETLVAQYPM